jgi:hypothetical protein
VLDFPITSVKAIYFHLGFLPIRTLHRYPTAGKWPEQFVAHVNVMQRTLHQPSGKDQYQRR